MAAQDPDREPQAITPSAFVRVGPDLHAEAAGQLLFGERFTITAERDGWAQGRAVRDGCAGWVSAAALGPTAQPTHWVRTLRALALSTPSADGKQNGWFPLNALVRVTEKRRGFSLDPHAGWFSDGDLAPLGLGFEADSVAVAIRCLATPYMKGARDGEGLDAVGLVQQALLACGLAAPRALTDLAGLGRPAPADEPPRRGDLVIWREHAGLMLDANRLIHADPSVGNVVEEPLRAVIALRGTPLAIRRL